MGLLSAQDLLKHKGVCVHLRYQVASESHGTRVIIHGRKLRLPQSIKQSPFKMAANELNNGVGVILTE